MLLSLLIFVSLFQQGTSVQQSSEVLAEVDRKRGQRASVHFGEITYVEPEPETESDDNMSQESGTDLESEPTTSSGKTEAQNNPSTLPEKKENPGAPSPPKAGLFMRLLSLLSLSEKMKTSLAMFTEMMTAEHMGRYKPALYRTEVGLFVLPPIIRGTLDDIFFPSASQHLDDQLYMVADEIFQISSSESAWVYYGFQYFIKPTMQFFGGEVINRFVSFFSFSFSNNHHHKPFCCC